MKNRLPIRFLLLLGATLAGAGDGEAQRCLRVNARADTSVRVAGFETVPSRLPSAGLGNSLRVALWVPEGKQLSAGGLRLYMDGRPIPDQGVTVVNPRRLLCDRAGAALRMYQEEYEFVPRRTSDSREQWGRLLGSPTSFTKVMYVGAGPQNGPEYDWVWNRPRVAFKVAVEWTFWLAAAAFVALLALLVYAARRTNLLRDHTPGGPPGTVPPYSLAKVVMAMWTFLILAGFFGIWLITGDPGGILNPQSFVLLGIVGVSGTMSAAITRGQSEAREREMREVALVARARRMEAEQIARQQAAMAPGAAVGLESMAVERDAAATTAEAKLAALVAEVPISRGFFADIISDRDGPAVYRFQNLLWNVAFGIVFVVGAYRALALPVFDPSVLALLGISEAIYLGMKLNQPPKASGSETQSRQSLAARVFGANAAATPAR